MAITFPWQESVRDRDQTGTLAMARELPAHIKNILNRPQSREASVHIVPQQLSAVDHTVGRATVLQGNDHRVMTELPNGRSCFQDNIAVSCEMGTSFVNTQNINMPKKVPTTHTFEIIPSHVISSSGLSSLCSLNANMQNDFSCEKETQPIK